MNSTESFAGGRDERLHAVIASHLDAVAAGRPDDRSRLLAEHPDLAAELREFFADRDRVGRLAEPMRAIAQPDAAAPPGGLPAGELGDFRLIREVGRGGMGVVYEAEQVSLGRRVALKVLPLAATMDPRQLQRFRHEARAAAMLHHGNIVPVYGVGCERGVHYYAMQMIEGRSLAAVIDELRQGLPSGSTGPFVPQGAAGAAGHRAPTAPVAAQATRKFGPDRAHYRRAAELVAQAADALEFAHSLGVVHRDIKPANLLLDAAGHLWVADFGLAKLGPGANLTVSGDLLGTLRYMSPEQALARHGLVDHRTDVYSLGATLYELLTLRPAVGGDDKQEVLRHIAFEEPVAPRKLDRSIPVELETVTLKALTKNPNERYATAGEFAADLRHWLADRAITARPPSLVQRAGKWARRHKALVGSAAAALGVAAVALGVVAWQSERARQAVTAEAQQTAAALATATKRLTQVERANEILGSVFKDLNPRAAEKEGKPLQAVLGERLDQATAAIEGEAIGDPLTVARMQMTLGQSQLALGYPEKAIRLFTLARATFTTKLGPDQTDTLTSMNNLAVGYQDAGQLDRALPLFEETLALRKAKLGPDDPETLTSLNNLANGYHAAGRLGDALLLHEEALKLRKTRLGPDHLNTLESLNNLAVGYLTAGRLGDALPLLEESLKLHKAKLGPDDPATLKSLNNLAEGYHAVGRHGDALPLYEESLKLTKAKLGPDHPDTLTRLNNLAEGYHAVGRHGDALPLSEEVLKRCKAKLGPDHPHTLASMSNLAAGYRAAGRHGDALPLLEAALELTKVKLGPDHPQTLTILNNLATGYRAADRLGNALPLFEEAFELRKAKLGPDHPDTLRSLNNLAAGYRAAGRLGDALPLFEKAVRLRMAKLGPDHPDTLASMNNLATGYHAAGRLGDARPLLEEAARSIENRQFRHQHAGMIVTNLTTCLEGLQVFDAAEPWRRKWLAVVRERAGPGSPAAAAELAGLGTNLLRQQKWADAETAWRECLAIRAKKEPDAWTTFNTQSVLGDSLLAQQKLADAEPLLLAGFTGMKQRADKMPKDAKARLADAAERLVRLYDALGKPDEAAKWLDEMWAWADTPGPAKP